MRKVDFCRRTVWCDSGSRCACLLFPISGIRYQVVYPCSCPGKLVTTDICDLVVKVIKNSCRVVAIDKAICHLPYDWVHIRNVVPFLATPLRFIRELLGWNEITLD